MTNARAKFIGTLQIAGIIHPHAGQEKVVLDALTEYDKADRSEPDTLHVPEIEDPVVNRDQVGVGEVADEPVTVDELRLSSVDIAILHEMIAGYREYKSDRYHPELEIYARTVVSITLPDSAVANAAQEPASIADAAQVSVEVEPALEDKPKPLELAELPAGTVVEAEPSIEPAPVVEAEPVAEPVEPAPEDSPVVAAEPSEAEIHGETHEDEHGD